MSKIEKNLISVIQESVKAVFPGCPEDILASVYL